MEINETNNYSRLLYIPRGLAIPFVALQYSEVKISIEIKKNWWELRKYNNFSLISDDKQLEENEFYIDFRPY